MENITGAADAQPFLHQPLSQLSNVFFSFSSIHQVIIGSCKLDAQGTRHDAANTSNPATIVNC
jgi:hypothetical protein